MFDKISPDCIYCGENTCWASESTEVILCLKCHNWFQLYQVKDSIIQYEYRIKKENNHVNMFMYICEVQDGECGTSVQVCRSDKDAEEWKIKVEAMLPILAQLRKKWLESRGPTENKKAFKELQKFANDNNIKDISATGASVERIRYIP